MSTVDRDVLFTGARAYLALKERQERAALGPRYDWYGDECPCGKALGECREHPRARPSQRPPGSYRASNPDSNWRIWLIKAGRGFGKSISAAKFVNAEVEAGRTAWVALVGATAADVRDYQIEHPYSGLIVAAPPWFKPTYEPSKRRVTWPNGAYATMFTSEEPEGLRGGGFNLAWVDELAKWSNNQQYTWDMLQFALREKTEPRPRVVVTTTPRFTPTYHTVRDDPRTAITGGKMLENEANLAEDYIADMQRRYGGTRLGRVELDADDLDDTPGALWKREWIDAHRLPAVPPGVGLRKVVVAVDPNAGAQDPEKAAETGITVNARGSDRRGYVLADCTLKGTPADWGKAALRAYAAWRADLIVAEKNNGGDMVLHTLKSIRKGPDHPAGSDVPIKLVWASRGKEIRAQPVAALYEQGRVSHVGNFNDLEDQMCRFDPDNPKQSGLLDRMDSLTWGMTEVMLGGGGPGIVLVGGRRN